jgi:hypothetical protein
MSQFDRVIQAKRQPGSSFKPFVYAAALDNGYKPTSIILDAPIEIDQGPGQDIWKPENYDKEYLRTWFAKRGYRGEGEPPAMPDDLVADVAARYIATYERLTGCELVPGERPVAERLVQSVGGCRETGLI